MCLAGLLKLLVNGIEVGGGTHGNYLLKASYTFNNGWGENGGWAFQPEVCLYQYVGLESPSSVFHKIMFGKIVIWV